MLKKYFINKNYGIMAFSKLISMSGSYIQEFALSLYVLKLTGSAAKFASVLAIALLPQLIIGPIAGVVVDWMNKKTILIIMDFLSGIITTTAIVFMLYYHRLPMYIIYCLVISLSAISVIYNTASTSTIVSIVEKDQLVEANSTNSFINTFTQVISGVFGGALYGFFGLVPCLILNAASFIFSCILQIFMTISEEVKDKKNININEFFLSLSEGFTFVKKQKYIFTLIVCAFFINFALSPFFSITETYIVKRIYKISDMQYGFFQTIVVLGGLGMPFVFPSIAKKINIENIFVYGLFSISIILGGITFTYSEFFIKLCGGTIIPYITFIFLTILVINAALMMNIANQTIFQQLIPRNMMGRAVSVMSTVCMAAMPMGQWMMGKLLDSVNSVFIGIGVCMIIFIVAVAFKIVVNASVEKSVDSVV